MAAKRLVAVLIGLAWLLSLATAAWADDRSFTIDRVEIHAQVDANGNMQMTEYDTYRFRGAFNGIVVDLDSAGSDGIENFEAYALSADGELEPLRIEESRDGTQITYRIYSTSKDEEKRFLLTYDVKNAVQVHADTAELYWQFIGTTNPNKLAMVTVNVALPGPVRKDEILAFGHGPANGQLAVSAGIVRYEVSPLKAGEMLEARILFPPSYVEGAQRVSDRLALERIKAEELRWADEADQRAAKAERLGWLLLYGAAGVILLNIAAIIILYFKYDKEYRPAWEGIYYRELPDEITPAVMSHLMTYDVSSRDVLATLMDLVRQRYIDIRVEEKAGSLLHRKSKDYIFKLVNPDRSGLRPHEADLVDWFFHRAPTNGEISLSAFRKQSQSGLTAGMFQLRYKNWVNLVEAEAKKRAYVEANPGKFIAVALALVQGFGLFWLLPEKFKWFAFVALPLLLFGLRIRRRTRVGSTEYRKWTAFKKFLVDYSQMAERDLLSVHLWEQYLVYAISLGVAKQVIALAHLNLQGVDDQHHPLYGTVVGQRMHTDFNHFTSTFEQSIAAAVNSSSSSASRGSGGGFSSGGGGGGGGGGRGAF